MTARCETAAGWWLMSAIVALIYVLIFVVVL